MDIRIIKEKISKKDLEELAKEFYVMMVKGVADIDRGVVALGGEWHMDANEVLIADGSTQHNLWGFNVYVADKKIEYVSLINIRPAQNNRTLEIQDENIKKAMYDIITKLID